MVTKKNKDPAKETSKKNSSKENRLAKKKEFLETIPERRKMRKAVENINIDIAEKRKEVIKENTEQVEIVSEKPIMPKKRTDPFLDAAPVENLEQGISNAPAEKRKEDSDNPAVLYNNAARIQTYGGIYSRDYETMARDKRDDVYPEMLNKSINIGRADFVMRAAQDPAAGELDRARLLNQNQVTTWRSSGSLESWERPDDKKYSSTIESGKKKKVMY